MKVGTIVVFAVVVVVTTMIIYVGSSSIRYSGPTGNEQKKIENAIKTGEIKCLNNLLVNTKSLSTKLIVLSYLKEYKSEESVADLIKMLSFDIPWWDKLDSELQPRPIDVRFSAYLVLAEYGRSIEGEITEEMKKSNLYSRLYSSALMYKFGQKKFGATITNYSNSRKEVSEDAKMLTVKLGLKDQ